MKMKKKLIALLSMATALMIAMSTTVAAADSLGSIDADDEAAIVPQFGPANAVYVEDPVMGSYATEGVFLENIPEDEWTSLDTTDDMMAGAEQLLVQKIATGEINALPIDAELLENDSLELTSVGGIDLASIFENSEDVAEEFIMVPAEDLGFTETEFLELALQQLRLVNKDPGADFPKWAVVYGTQTITGWKEEPDGSGNWYYYMDTILKGKLTVP